MSWLQRREQEIAVRYSLGGSRGAIAGQLLTEAAVLVCTALVTTLVAIVAGVALIAALVPAVRAAYLQPMRALRGE